MGLKSWGQDVLGSERAMCLALTDRVSPRQRGLCDGHFSPSLPTSFLEPASQPVPPFQHPQRVPGARPALSAGAFHRELLYLSQFYAYGNN